MSDKALALKQELSSPAMKSQIKAALPKHVPEDAFVRTTMTVLSQNPKLLECRRETLLSAILNCASLGLMPDAQLGEAYIIPYKGDATLQIGYKGLLSLARRSGEIASIDSGIAYENDVVEYIMGDNSSLTIKPCLDGDPGEPRFAWCVIRMKDGGVQREIMPVAEVEKIRQASPSGNSPAWKSSWDQMARKTVVRRALKFAPRSTELARAEAIDDTPPRMLEAPVETQPAKRPANRLEALAAQPDDRVDVATGEVMPVDDVP
jgi:recombination protein RecT